MKRERVSFESSVKIQKKKPTLASFLLPFQTMDERLEAESAYYQALEAWRRDKFASYLSSSPQDLPVSVLKELLGQAGIVKAGSRRLLEWRWSQHRKGLPVLMNTQVKASNKAPPVQRRFPHDPLRRDGIFCIPRDVLMRHILVWLSWRDVLSCLYTCKQWQSAAHSVLSEYARIMYGPCGTPMAFTAQSHFFFQFEFDHVMKTYGCVEHFKESQRRKESNIEAREVEEAFIQETQKELISNLEKAIAPYTFDVTLKRLFTHPMRQWIACCQENFPFRTIDAWVIDYCNLKAEFPLEKLLRLLPPRPILEILAQVDPSTCQSWFYCCLLRCISSSGVFYGVRLSEERMRLYTLSILKIMTHSPRPFGSKGFIWYYDRVELYIGEEKEDLICEHPQGCSSDRHYRAFK